MKYYNCKKVGGKIQKQVVSSINYIKETFIFLFFSFQRNVWKEIHVKWKRIMNNRIKIYNWRTLYSKFDPFIMCDWQFMSWSRTKIPFSCQVFKSPKSFEHESTVTTTGLELDLYRRRSLKVQSQSVNETIGQMMLYNKLKASVTSGSLVCGELFYASESPLEPERRRLYVLLYLRSASAISHMTFAIGQQKKTKVE